MSLKFTKFLEKLIGLTFRVSFPVLRPKIAPLKYSQIQTTFTSDHKIIFTSFFRTIAMSVISQRNAFQFIIFYIVRCVVIFQITTPFASSSSSVSRSNYNVYNYDQTTPQFTPDGRLLQVEYASSAADLSSPLVAVEFFSPLSQSYSGGKSKKVGDDYHDEDGKSLSYPCTVLITVPKKSSSPQNRIVIIENQSDLPNSSLRSISPQHRSYCVAMSGILADSLALLQAGMKVAAEHSLQFKDSFGMESLAQALADECQTRVFAGGLRPYGSTLLLCGYDERNIDDNQTLQENGNKNNSNKTQRRKLLQSRIYQTDPSGGILQHNVRESEEEERSKGKSVASKKHQSKRFDASANNDVVQSQVRCIVGGSSTFKRQLRKQINQGITKFEQRQQQHRNRKESTFSLADRIANVAKIPIKETAHNGGTPNSAGNNRSKSRDNKENSLASSISPLEIVIVSPRLGCHRLEGKQLQAIQDLINADKKGHK